jgi:hypothetical protein
MRAIVWQTIVKIPATKRSSSLIVESAALATALVSSAAATAALFVASPLKVRHWLQQLGGECQAHRLLQLLSASRRIILPGGRFLPNSPSNTSCLRLGDAHRKAMLQNHRHTTATKSHTSILINNCFYSRKSNGGDGGIRTLDTPLRAYNGLANRRLQPLGHVSSGKQSSLCPELADHARVAPCQTRTAGSPELPCRSIFELF